MSRYQLLAALVVVTGCFAGELIVYTSAAAEKRIQRANDRVAVLDIPAEEKKAIKAELDDARQRVSQIRRYHAPTKPPPEVKLGSEEDNRKHNAMESKAHGAKRWQEVVDTVLAPVRFVWKVLKFIHRWGLWILATVGSALFAIWVRKHLRYIYGIIVRQIRDSDNTKEQKRAQTEDTPAQAIYRKEREVREESPDA